MIFRRFMMSKQLPKTMVKNPFQADLGYQKRLELWKKKTRIDFWMHLRSITD